MIRQFPALAPIILYVLFDEGFPFPVVILKQLRIHLYIAISFIHTGLVCPMCLRPLLLHMRRRRSLIVRLAMAACFGRGNPLGFHLCLNARQSPKGCRFRKDRRFFLFFVINGFERRWDILMILQPLLIQIRYSSPPLRFFHFPCHSFYGTVRV